jgi:hypothetical protein
MERLTSGIWSAERGTMKSFIDSSSWTNALGSLEAISKSLSHRKQVRTAASYPAADRSITLCAGVELAFAGSYMVATMGLKPVLWHDSLARATEALAAEWTAAECTIDIRETLILAACNIATNDELHRGGVCRSLPQCVTIAANVFDVGAHTNIQTTILAAAYLLAMAGKNVCTRDGVIANKIAMRAAAIIIARSSTLSVAMGSQLHIASALGLLRMRAINLRWIKGDQEVVIEMIKLLVGTNGVSASMVHFCADDATPTAPMFVFILHDLVIGSLLHYSLPRELCPGIAASVWQWIGMTEQGLRREHSTSLADSKLFVDKMFFEVMVNLASNLLNLVRSEAVAGECVSIFDIRAAVNTSTSLLLTMEKVNMALGNRVDLVKALAKGYLSLDRLVKDNKNDKDISRIVTLLRMRLSPTTDGGSNILPVTAGVYTCCNLGCRNLEGGRDLEIKTKACGLGGCLLRYCSTECQIAVWKGGHNKCCPSHRRHHPQ